MTVAQVRRLIVEQFPQWSSLPVRAVDHGGWDNWTFRLGSTLSVRLPSAAEYGLAVDKEHRWLPVLAPQLPMAVPNPLGRGEPGAGYPFSWSVYGWLPGQPMRADLVRDPVRFAGDLAAFLEALRRVDPTGGPRPGVHSWFRGGTLRTFDETVRDAVTTLGDTVDADRVHAVWAAALEARWDGVASWFHGDVAAGNLLLDGGDLAAVIDFGTCGVGDPACDVAAAWTLLTTQGRRVFRDQLDIDDGEWARGRGWALWKALSGCAATADRPSSGEGIEPRRVLSRILAAAP
ncbi:aminoglycoside phosphotransferase family protein [Knoellia locipacati]|uniref:aminoglycoside phosphotransferase family protein n=1 Tax=Knoellia locipacati TaxID=882824 RepID=UPI00384E3049